MSSLFQLISLLATARAICVLPTEDKHQEKEKKSCTTICPELCLMEPGCKNEILAKFNIGLFLLESTSVSVDPADTETVTTTTEDCDMDSEDNERLVPLKIMKFHERRDSCCTSNSVVVSFVKPILRPTHDCAFLIISPKSNACHSVPHVFAATFNHSAGIEQKVISDNHQVVYKIPMRDIDSLLVTITDLGIANAGTFKKNNDCLEVVLESDIFTHGPLVASICNLSDKICVPESFRLPNNTMLRLAAIQKDLKNSIVQPIVVKTDLNKMAVAAFINEIRYLFNCPKKVEKCEQEVCEKVVSEYCTFVSACVKALAYCEEKNEQCTFVQPASCPEENKYSCLSNGIASYAKKCNIANVKVATEINVLFSEVCPLIEFNQEEPECLKMIEIDASDASNLENEAAAANERKAALAQKKPAAAVKTSTTVSTYGWYVAGGVVAVSVAVAVYVFAL